MGASVDGKMYFCAEISPMLYLIAAVAIGIYMIVWGVPFRLLIALTVHTTLSNRTDIMKYRSGIRMPIRRCK